MKILIVDDEPGTRLTVSEAVERLGHRALQAADGDEGLRAFEFHHPEVADHRLGDAASSTAPS